MADLEQVIIKNSHFADFEQVISHFAALEQVIIKYGYFAGFGRVLIKYGHFGDLEQVKNILLTMNKPKTPNSKTPVREAGYLCIFLFRPLPRVTGTPPWFLRPMRVSTNSELYPDTWLFFCFLNA